MATFPSQSIPAGNSRIPMRRSTIQGPRGPSCSNHPACSPCCTATAAGNDQRTVPIPLGMCGPNRLPPGGTRTPLSASGTSAPSHTAPSWSPAACSANWIPRPDAVDLRGRRATGPNCGKSQMSLRAYALRPPPDDRCRAQPALIQLIQLSQLMLIQLMQLRRQLPRRWEQQRQRRAKQPRLEVSSGAKAVWPLRAPWSSRGL